MNQITYRNISYSFAVGVALLGLTSCQDEMLFTEDNIEINSDMILFDASIGKCEVSTRSGEVPTDIDPLVLGDGENQLYLHTYVCDNGYNPVEFQPEMSSTRGVQIKDMPTLETEYETFGVEANFAQKSGFPYYIPTNIGVKANDNYWRPNGHTVYWPGDDAKLHFHAWAPAELPAAIKNLNKEQNKVSFDYTAEKSANNDRDAEVQTDFLWAINKGCSKSTATNGSAPLRFTHPLSAIKFAVRDVLGGTIKSITIKNVYSEASCTYTADDSGEGSYFWTNHAEKKDFTQVFNMKVTPSSDGKTDVSITERKPEATFMMIPQTIEDDAKIEIVMEQEGLQDTDGNSLPNRTIAVRGKIKVDDETNNPNKVTAWLPGKEYIYTISTSKDNWIYIFDAEGNDAEGTENIYVYSPTHESFGSYGNTAYFNVKSYRYRANDYTRVEPLPWKASHGGSFSYWVNGANETAYPTDNPDLKKVTSEQWITDEFATPLSGKGIGSHSDNLELHNLSFLPHYVSTTWKGDETMQGYAPYSGYDQAKPYDLSTFGKTRTRNTANCYIVDRGGWYMFPLVYGNAIKNGSNNPSSYESACTATDRKVKKILVDYNNQNITQSYIKNVNDKYSATLVWQDAYDMVDHVELITINGERMIRFFVESNNLQQGNAVIALKDNSGTVVWSWHIWATEHWLDPTTRLPHVYDNGNASFNFVVNSTTGIRERGDVEVTYNQKNRSFMMSPYNLGYCDPKSVLYLKRKNNMEFVQYMPDGTTPTKLTDKLPIIQDGATIEYKYANNTYYQWGRKDPMRGYFNHENSLKQVFGSMPPEIQPQENITIGKSIQNPHVFFAGKGASGSLYEDWLSDQTSNLWNNNSDLTIGAQDNNKEGSDFWSHTKTIYDPSPAGYLIPNAGVWHVAHKSYGDPTWNGNDLTLEKFKERLNGEYIDDYNYKVWGKGNANNDSEALFFSSTGNRWWSNKHLEGWTAGDNFGRNVSYAWSNRYASKNNAYGLAIGLDTDRPDIDDVPSTEKLYYLGAHFIGRRAMGRPVRAIREP